MNLFSRKPTINTTVGSAFTTILFFLSLVSLSTGATVVTCGFIECVTDIEGSTGTSLVDQK